MEGITNEIYDFLISQSINEVLANLIITTTSVLLWILIGLLLNFIVKKIIRRVIKASKNNSRSLTVGKLLNSVVRYVLWFIIGVSIMGELNIDIAPIIATAGVLGLAIGFGAQEIVRDFISGFFIIFEGTFNVGDVVEVDGFKGNVLSLGLRTTSIENWKGEVKIINNGDINSIINFSRNNSIAVVEFGVDYSTDLSKFNELMEDFIDQTFEKYDAIVEEPKFLGVKELADSSINMILIAKTNTMQHFQVERDLRKDIVQFCTENNVEIPFPHIVVKNG